MKVLVISFQINQKIEKEKMFMYSDDELPYENIVLKRLTNIEKLKMQNIRNNIQNTMEEAKKAFWPTKKIRFHHARG